MFLGDVFVVMITALYICACLAYAWQHQTGSSIMFFSYALANFGFLMQLHQR